MRSFRSLLFTSVFGLLLNFASNAQTPDMSREVGLRFPGSNLNAFLNSGPQFVYKKQKTENKYRRLRISGGGFGLADLSPVSLQFTTSAAIGKEIRHPLSDRFNFVHGLELQGDIGLSVKGNNSNLSLGLGFGVPLGFQYNLEKPWGFFVETIPAVRGYIYNNAGGSRGGVNLSGNLLNLGLGVVHRF